MSTRRQVPGPWLFHPVLAVALLAAFLAAQTVYGGDADEGLLDNPGFERVTQDGRPAGWIVSSHPEAVTLDSVTVHGGSRSIRHQSVKGLSYTVHQEIPASSGQRYSFSGWVRVSDVSGFPKFALQLLALNVHGGVIQTIQLAGFGAATGDWQEVRVPNVAMPKGTVRARLVQRIDNLKGTVNVDDLVLMPATDLSAAPGTPAAAIAANTPTATADASATPGATGATGATPTGTATAAPTATATGTPTATVTTTPATATSTATPTVGQSGNSNDDFDSATLIGAFPFTSNQDTLKATVASDDPDMGSGTGVNSNTVWYRFVAPSDGGITAHTFGSDYDTVLAGFSGSRGHLELLDGNDDADSGTQSRIAFNVRAGTTYYLEAATYGGGPGGGKLRLSVELGDTIVATATPTTVTWEWPTSTPTPTPGQPPTNDDIDAGTPIDALPYTATLDVTGATTGGDDPDMGAGSGVNSRTVWFRLVPAETATIRASTSGSDYDTVLAIFSGSRGRLQLVASNDDYGDTSQSQVGFEAQAGVTYHLEVAAYGLGSGGQLRLSLDGNAGLTTAMPTPSSLAEIPPSVPGAAPVEIPPPLAHTQPVPRDARYFQETGYRVNLDPFWDYFQRRGGVGTFGYPISREFPLLGFKVQLFQRAMMQLMPDGSVAIMNLTDDGLIPLTQVNFSVFPQAETELKERSPQPADPDYAQQATVFLEANLPDRWEGLPVGFLRRYMSTVRYEDAFPEGGGEPALLPLLNLEMWGLPTSRPAFDPNNHNFVYQRFQRGILHYDHTTGATQGLLLGDYFKAILTGQNLPPDLDREAAGSRFYRQFDRSKPGSLARPGELPGTNLQGAFE